MREKAEIFFDAITLLSEELVEEAQSYRFRRRSRLWRQLGNLAACLLLVTAVSLSGALLLTARGCGSSGGAPDMAPSAADSAAPADSPSGDASDGNMAPAPTLRLEARVTEILAYGITAELLPESREAELADVETLVIPLAELPKLEAGDRIQVVCSGVDRTAEPPRAVDIIEILVLETDG